MAFAVAVALTVLVAVADYLTGPYLAFATVYMIPVGLAAWFGGRRAATVVAVLASSLGMLTTAADPGEVSAGVNLANGVLRFVLYLIVGLVLATEREAIRTIAALATVDPLTGLINRRHFAERSGRELARARRDDDAVAVVYIDVDDLKARNDSLGHGAGDALLESFAQVARDALRGTDLLARMGGDEFAVLLPGSDGTSAEGTVERIRADLRAAVDPPITFSAGVVAGHMDEAMTVAELLQIADQAMFQAKAAGKNRTVTVEVPVGPFR